MAFETPPLPNFNVAPPQIANPLDQYARAAALRNMLSETALRQQLAPFDIQEAQARAQTAQTGAQLSALQLQDEEKLRTLATQHITKDESGNVTGFDYNGFLNDATGAGVSPIRTTQILNAHAEAVKNLAGADEATRTNETQKNTALYEGLESLRSVPVDQRSLALKQLLPSLANKGIDTSKIPLNTPLDDASLSQFEAGLGVHAQALADAKAQAEIDKDTSAEFKEIPGTGMFYNPITGQTKTPAGVQLSPQMMESKYVSIQQARAKGQAISADDAAFAKGFEKMKTLVPAFNFSLAGGATGGLDQAAIDMQAEKYFQTGQLPPVGRSAAGLALTRMIMQRAADLHAGQSLAEGSAEFKANQQSLKALQSNLDQVTAFENTALKNLDMFTTLAQKAIDTGVPLANAPLRTAAQLLGSKDQAAFEAARQVAVNEIAKVTSSPGLSGQLSDTARREVASFIPANATVGQIISLSNTLKQDMANRTDSYQQQIGDIQRRFSGPAKSGGTGFSVPTGAPAAPKEDGKVLKQNGNIIAVSKGGQWVAPPSR